MSGGMGSVYVAKHTDTGRPVALKVIKSGSADDPNFVGRFRRETGALAAVSHPNVVGFLGCRATATTSTPSTIACSIRRASGSRASFTPARARPTKRRAAPPRDRLHRAPRRSKRWCADLRRAHSVRRRFAAAHRACDAAPVGADRRRDVTRRRRGPLLARSLARVALAGVRRQRRHRRRPGHPLWHPPAVIDRGVRTREALKLSALPCMPSPSS